MSLIIKNIPTIFGLKAKSLPPTYTLSRSVVSVNEGASFTITLTTTNVVNGSVLPYTITGVSSADISGASLTGNFTVNNGVATLNVNTTADAITEGTETFTLTLDGGLGSISVTLNDTSLSPTYSLSRSVAAVNEGQSFTVTLDTTGLANGTTVPYTITGVTSADINSASLTGNFTINGNTATLNVVTTADLATEGTETFTLSLDGGLGSISVTINDTSTAEPNIPAGTQSILLHLNSSLADSSPNNVALASNVGVTYDTTNFKFGTAAALFNSTSDCLRYTNSSLFTFGTGTFAIDCWIRITGNTTAYGGQRIAAVINAGYITGSNSDQWSFHVDGNASTTGTGLIFQGYQSTNVYEIKGNFTFAKNTWYHVAVGRDTSGVVSLYVNGTKLTNTTYTFTPSISIGNRIANPLRIGNIEVTGWLYEFVGQIDEVRIAKGTYFPNSFTPPTAPYA